MKRSTNMKIFERGNLISEDCKGLCAKTMEEEKGGNGTSCTLPNLFLITCYPAKCMQPPIG